MLSPQRSHGLSVGSQRVHVWLFRLNYPYSEGYSRSALANLRNRLNVIKQSVSSLAAPQDKTQLPLKEDDKIHTINNIKSTMSIIHWNSRDAPRSRKRSRLWKRKSLSTQKGWEIAEEVKLAEKDVKTITLFKHLKESRNRTRREVEAIKKEQMGLLD